MIDTDHQLRHWLYVHERVRRDIRRIVLLLAVLAAIAVIQGFGRLQNLNEVYQIARDFTLQLQDQNPRTEAAQLFNSMCQKKTSDCRKNHIRVRLEKIPEVGYEFSRYIKKNHPSGTFEVSGYKLGYASFALLLLFAPLTLLLVVYLRVRTTARIAMMLREQALDFSEVQQRLNSVFDERATEKFGERRWIYAIIWMLILLSLTLIPPFFYLTMQTMRVANTDVVIDNQGNISTLPEVGLNDRTSPVRPDKIMLALSIVIFLSIVGLGLLVGKSVLIQLRPKKDLKVINTEDTT